MGLFILHIKQPNTSLNAPHNENVDFPALVRRESNSGAYFAGMFRVANVEFIPEYRQEESNEFASMANKIQHVVCISVTLLINGCCLT